MSLSISQKIESIRKEMRENGLSAYIIPSSDPHLSEYPAPHWKTRGWISGFDGSFGTVILTLKEAALFTDSRYFLQATSQLENTGIHLVKMGLPDSPSFAEWLTEKLAKGSSVGIDPWVYAASDALALDAALRKKELFVNAKTDFISKVWEDRPKLPSDPIFVFPIEFSGRSSQEKISQLREILAKEGCDYLLLSALDEIAWTFNIRGNDVKYNPVVISFALISKDKSVLFIPPSKINREDLHYFKQEEIQLADYNKIAPFLSHLPAGSKIMLDASKTNLALYNSIPSECKIIKQVSPANRLKSLKNEIEIEGYKQAMIYDGIALTKFFIWLDENVDKGTVTEYTVGEMLKEFRSQQPYYAGEGFGTITGYKDHGAVIHYIPTPDNAYTIARDGTLLIDSGGQYFKGTTDITRTITLSTPSEKQKKDFTLILKGNIALGTAVFPQKTRGSQIDILARKVMWENGINYLHGTGHGVGHFLNVHEGPQSIRMEENPVVLEPGMVLSNEPGIYRNGEYGLRIENMILIKEKEETQFGKFFQCETITLFPIDKNLIEKELLNQDELNWLNDYHQMVYDKLSPYLNEKEKEWLKNQTEVL